MEPTDRPISSSPVSEIHVRADGTLLKLYRPGIPPQIAEREARLTRAVAALGVRTPNVLEVLAVGPRTGVILEHIGGTTMLQRLVDAPGAAVELARQLAGLQADLHELDGGELPDFATRMRVKIGKAKGLPAALIEQALSRFDALSPGTALCHGDLQPGSVMLTDEGPVIIDWYDANCGNPAADVARTLMTLRHSAPAELMGSAVLLPPAESRAEFGEAYLRHYAERRPLDRAELDAWRLPVVAARLAELVSVGEYNELVALATRLARS